MRSQSSHRCSFPKPNAFLRNRTDLSIAVMLVFFCLGTSLPTFADQPSPTPILDAQTRTSVIDAAAKALEDKYIFPEIGKQMADKIRANDASKAYYSLTNSEDLAKRLTDG